METDSAPTGNRFIRRMADHAADIKNMYHAAVFCLCSHGSLCWHQRIMLRSHAVSDEPEESAIQYYKKLHRSFSVTGADIISV